MEPTNIWSTDAASSDRKPRHAMHVFFAPRTASTLLCDTSHATSLRVTHHRQSRRPNVNPWQVLRSFVLTRLFSHHLVFLSHLLHRHFTLQLF